jgi:hypothetical protein
MKAGNNRPGRKDHPRLRRALGTALMPIALATVSVATPAQALTGGASTLSPGSVGTGRGLTFSPTRSARATWYGPGFYGSRTACGQVLRPQTIGVAHRRLPCGTAVRFYYRGQRVIARVIDRGPFTRGRTWDLTNGARMALRFNGSGVVRYAIAQQGKRR